MSDQHRTTILRELVASAGPFWWKDGKRVPAPEAYMRADCVVAALKAASVADREAIARDLLSEAPHG